LARWATPSPAVSSIATSNSLSPRIARFDDRRNFGAGAGGVRLFPNKHEIGGAGGEA
jgi:hypothetical protein